MPDLTQSWGHDNDEWSVVRLTRRVLTLACPICAAWLQVSPPRELGTYEECRRGLRSMKCPKCKAAIGDFHSVCTHWDEALCSTEQGLRYSALRFPTLAVALAEAIRNGQLTLIDPGVNPKIAHYPPDPGTWGTAAKRCAQVDHIVLLGVKGESASLLIEATNLCCLLNNVVDVPEPEVFADLEGERPRALMATVVTEKFMSEWLLVYSPPSG